MESFFAGYVAFGVLCAAIIVISVVGVRNDLRKRTAKKNDLAPKEPTERPAEAAVAEMSAPTAGASPTLLQATLVEGPEGEEARRAANELRARHEGGDLSREELDDALLEPWEPPAKPS